MAAKQAYSARTRATRVTAALAYDAPYLVEKLLKEGNVDTATEAEALFLEVKRYLALAASSSEPLDMFSSRVDGAWHQFILFTQHYSEFCERFFGRYLHHRPNTDMDVPQAKATSSRASNQRAAPSFVDFQARYQALYGASLPEFWYDRRSVTTERRVLNRKAGQLTLGRSTDSLDLIDTSGEVLFGINEPGERALAFIAETSAFYVRELPGGLDDGEKVALVSTLVDAGVLRMA